MYCSELSVLSSCVESVVHSRCSQTASHLVNVLVRSSVQLSPLCTTDMLATVSNIHTYLVTCRWIKLQESPANAMVSARQPSVRLSNGWISQKRLKLGSCSFHHRVAPISLVFAV